MNSEHIEAYLSGELDESARQQMERAFRNDRELRSSFLQQLQVHSALGVMIGDEAAEKEASFNESVMAHLNSEGADDHREFAKSVLTEIVEEREGLRAIRWPDLIKAGVISAAASIALMFLLQSVIFGNAQGPPSDEAKGNSSSFVARLEASEDLQWSPATFGNLREDGWLTPGLLEIESGQAKIAFNSGATSTIEGPAKLSIESNNRVFLKFGRIVSEVPKPASGFTVNTPRLNVVDLGTRFGVSVNRNGDSELHVMEGVVEASRTQGNSVSTLVREGLALRADERTRSELSTIPYNGESFVLTLDSSPAPQPSLRFTFDESEGGIIEDSGSLRHFDVPIIATGEMYQSPHRAPGYSGSGLVFRRGEFIEVPLSREFRLEEPHTISFWLKIPPRINRSSGDTLLHYGREGLGWALSCNLDLDQASKGALRVDHGGGHIVGSTDIADGNWHHVACRFIGGENASLQSHLHLFVDGKQESLSDSQAGAIEQGRASQLIMGSHQPSRFEGWIDELYFFRDAIPTSAIQNLSK